ncbi:unnamed protein product [Effrenium voratum]|nr:unnamed protein product [Effrenium voratum]
MVRHRSPCKDVHQKSKKAARHVRRADLPHDFKPIFGKESTFWTAACFGMGRSPLLGPFLQVSTALRRLGWAPRLRRLTSADPEADEWVFFPQVDDRPSFFWNRRTDQSVWQKPPVEPAWLGFPAEDRAFFRCVRTKEKMWTLPPLVEGVQRSAGEPLSAEDHLRFLLEAEWARLQRQEEALRLAGHTSERSGVDTSVAQ